jgi:predicted TIM-barrel fold metal-dependent hydrolase
MCEDRVIGRSGTAGASAEITKLSAIGRAGIEDDGFRAGTPALRLQDLDRDGLAASVIYGPLALGLPIEDPALQEACYAAWNDWAIEEFNAVAPDRLCVLAFLPGHSPEAAAAELERAAGRGHRGAIIDVFSVDIGDPGWDRLWSAAEQTGLPVSFHIKGGSWSGLSYRLGKWQSAAFATIMPLQFDEVLATMVFCGALERHPGATIVLAESGVGWLAYFLARMDLEWEALRDKIAGSIDTPPSELFRRQVMATFEEDSLAADVIPRLGADSCMWASDYPHTDSTFPNSLPAIEETLGTLAADARHKVTAGNCARLYGFAERAPGVA